MRTMVTDYEIDDDPGRIDTEAAVEFLLTEAYWGKWRGSELIVRQIREAWRVVGVYDPTGAMVGFARAFGDGTAAYLADVYVLSDYRGVGLGKAIVRAMIDDGPGADWRWMLHTSDAHGFYQQFGFAPPSTRYLERPRRGLQPGGRAGVHESAKSNRAPILYGMAKSVLVRVQPYENWHPPLLAGRVVLQQGGEDGQPAPSHCEVHVGQGGCFPSGEARARMDGQQPKNASRLRIQVLVRPVEAGAHSTSHVLQLIQAT